MDQFERKCPVICPKSFDVMTVMFEDTIQTGMQSSADKDKSSDTSPVVCKLKYVSFSWCILIYINPEITKTS